MQCSGGDVCAHVCDVITPLCMQCGMKNLHIATVRMTSLITVCDVSVKGF